MANELGVWILSAKESPLIRQYQLAERSGREKENHEVAGRKRNGVRA